jgi:anti-sigma factor RsiW
VSGLPAPDERLSAYLDGELDAEERSAVDDLLARSEAWRSELDEVGRARAALRRLAERAAPPGFWASILAAEDDGPAVPVSRAGRGGLVAGVAAVAAAAVAVLAVPVEDVATGGGASGREPRGEEATVRSPGARDRAAADDDGGFDDFVDRLLAPFSW